MPSNVPIRSCTYLHVWPAEDLLQLEDVGQVAGVLALAQHVQHVAPPADGLAAGRRRRAQLPGRHSVVELRTPGTG